MKQLLVLAHTPPPHHGQSYMVQMLLQALGGAPTLPSGPPSVTVPPSGRTDVPKTNWRLYHVNFRLSTDVVDIGQVRFTKLLLVLRYCFSAILCRLRFGVKTFLYVPAPGKRPPLYRDWLVMALCRPFFPSLILYWEAAGLGSWLEIEGWPWERWLTQKLLGHAQLSLVLGDASRNDGTALHSLRVAVVPNTVEDPCPDSWRHLVTVRKARAAARQRILDDLGASEAGGSRDESTPLLYRVVYLGLCSREKGLLDAVDAVDLVNRKLAAASARLRVRLDIGGTFVSESERDEFAQRCRSIGPQGVSPPGSPDACSGETAAERLVQYHGFVSGESKRKLFIEGDCFCFPTYYHAESFPLVLLEAMAYGLDVVTTRWRNIPELLPDGYPGLVEPRSPSRVAAAIGQFLGLYLGETLRQRYEERYAPSQYQVSLERALSLLDAPAA